MIIIDSGIKKGNLLAQWEADIKLGELWTSVELNNDASDFAQTYDRGLPVKPFSFEIEEEPETQIALRDGFECCRYEAMLICLVHGRKDLAKLIEKTPVLA